MAPPRAVPGRSLRGRRGHPGGGGVCARPARRRPDARGGHAARARRRRLRAPRRRRLRVVARRPGRRAAPSPARADGAGARGPARLRATGLCVGPRDLALQRAGAPRRAPAVRRGVRRLDGQDRRHRFPLHPRRQRHAVDGAGAGSRARAPRDQALPVCNAVAEALGGDVRVFHLAYHDTLVPPASVRPAPSVSAEFAPRERCYAHALDDPACTTNHPYREAFERHLERFAGRVHVFEYYADAILFGGCAVPLVEVCGADLEYYRRAGACGVSCLTFGRYSLWAHGANLEAFARAAIRPADAPAARRAHCSRRFGAAAGPMTRYLAALEALMRRVVTYGDVKLPPAREAVRTALDRALAAAPALRSLLHDATASGAPPAQLAAEARLLDYTLATLAAVRGWVR